jgi:SAM-dependent methyltransferase
MDPLINWDELRKLTMPPIPAGEKGTKGPIWDDSADMYNQMAKMEKSYTLNQINAFATSKDDTVLDIGCGPGRISVPMAQRAKSVTSIDTSEKMLAHCKKNAQDAGVTNLNAHLLDWKEAVLGENLEQHDIVIASRSVGASDIKKASRFARKYVVFIAWANSPNIPMIRGDLFKGIEKERKMPPMMMDRRLSYNITFNMIYDLGYEPNIKIVTDGFTREFLSREEAYEELWKLRTIPDNDIPPIFRQNVDKWLIENNKGGVTFKRETRSYVIWWDTEPVQFQM